MSESDYEPGDYFALALNADASTYALDLNNPDGTLKQVVDATGTVQYIGANYLFYVGDAWPGGNGTILTASPSLSLGIFGSASLPVNVVNPSTSALDNAFACASGSPGIPVVTDAVSSDGLVTLSWTPPPSQGSSAVTGYVVYANDLTDPSQNDSQPITDLTMNGDTYTASILGLFDGDTYTFSVAAENPQGIGSFSDPSSPLAIPGASADDPFGLSVSQGSEYFAVTWNYPSDDADSVANYKVVGLDQTDYANDVTDVCPNQGSESLSQTCDVPGVTAGDTYIFFVEALDENGEVSGVSSASPPSIALASPFDDPVAVSADSTNTWFANYVGGPHATGSVTMVNDVSNAVTEIDSTYFVNPDAISSDGTDVWVANENGVNGNGIGSVTELDASTGAVIQNITSPDFDQPVAISSDGTHVWVLNQFGGSPGTGSIVELDAATGDEVRVIQSSFFADPVAIDSDGTRVWVADQSSGDSGDVVDYDIADHSIEDLTPVGLESPGAISSDGTHVWVADNPGSGTGSVFEHDVATGEEVRDITDASITYPVGISASGDYVWVANSNGYDASGGEVSRITVSNGDVTEDNDASIDGPTGISANNGDVWLSDSLGGTNGLGNYS
ncbi:MAG: fibronectin type III domain-containing protein, partial [Acidimicrobiales bacterium]